jgi:hypothetical protein
MKKTGRIWKNRKKIIEGFYNAHLNFTDRELIDKVSNERLAICRSNQCGLYDQFGTGMHAVIKGKESCGGCGCLLKEKTSCLSCECFLSELGQEPLWKEVKN